MLSSGVEAAWGPRDAVLALCSEDVEVRQVMSGAVALESSGVEC
jgi:hypothetical protein